MALLNKTKQGQFVFRAGKHNARTLDEVATNDPGYLTWIWKKLPEFEMDTTVVDRLEDTMLKLGIPFK